MLNNINTFHLATVAMVSSCNLSFSKPNVDAVAKGTKEDPAVKVGLPPDPGEEGKKTLLGVDSDNDGLRDDVQRWIYRSYPNEPLLQKALSQVARDHIESFGFLDNKEQAIRASFKFLKSVDCLYEIFDLVTVGERDLFKEEELFSVIENTPDRFKAARKLDSHFSGQLSSQHAKPFTYCRFEVEHPRKKEIEIRYERQKIEKAKSK